MRVEASAAINKRRRQRFVAPAREDLAPGAFAHPVFRDFAEFGELLRALAWPDLAALNARVDPSSPRFAAQTPAMLADRLHYETRIARHDCIATREGNWHDLLNALVWLRYPGIKRALNSRQVADIEIVGARERTRGQCALTLFDEGGIVVITRDTRLLEAWDRHDWPQLFGAMAPLWQSARLLVFGHALLEHSLDPGHLLVGKALVIQSELDPQDARTEPVVLAALADAIAGGQVLLDPKELRALPLSGLEGWHPSSLDVAERERFLHAGECFRPLAAGRHYPEPLTLPRMGAASGIAPVALERCVRG